MHTMSAEKPKVVKSDEEFKQHQRSVMDERIVAINNAINKKYHILWNQYLSHKTLPTTLQFKFVFNGMDQYLKVCDSYKPAKQKKSKSEWWSRLQSNQMSYTFLPSILNKSDKV